jgi:hypothetical protein
MAALQKLYAWAVPVIVPGSPWDHTWVASYDNRAHPYPDIAAVKRAKQDYWYCWGGFHAQGGTPNLPDGSLGSQNGDVKLRATWSLQTPIAPPVLRLAGRYSLMALTASAINWPTRFSMRPVGAARGR